MFKIKPGVFVEIDELQSLHQLLEQTYYFVRGGQAQELEDDILKALKELERTIHKLT